MSQFKKLLELRHEVRRLELAYKYKVKRSKITLNEIELMHAINRVEDITVKELCDTTYFLTSNVSPTLKKLIQSDLVKTSMDKLDRRIVRISLTTAGKKVCATYATKMENSY